jgi:hypothetical protein
MAFNIQNLARASVSMQEPLTPIFNPTIIPGAPPVPAGSIVVDQNGCFRDWNYYGITYTVTNGVSAISGDSQATMAASGYFNDAANQLQVGDLIKCYSASLDTYQVYQVIGISAAGVVTTFPVGSSTVDVLLTSANLLGMFAAPVLVIPAPGANRTYQITNWSLSTQPVTGPVVYAGGGPVGLQYGNTVNLGGPAASATIPATVLTTGTPANLGMAGAAAAFGIAAAAKVNAGIYISNTTAAFTGGNSTAILSITYETIQIV